jgi:hypothetical protein
MPDSDPMWTQDNAIAFEATQELLTKIITYARRRLSQLDGENERAELLDLIVTAEKQKKTISPTSTDLRTLRDKYSAIVRRLSQE